MKYPLISMAVLSLGMVFSHPQAIKAETDWFSRLDQQFETTFEQSDAAFDRALSEGITELDRELNEIWGQARALPEAKKWIGYSEDRKKRVIVDYDKGEISVEGIGLDQTDLMGEFQDILLEDSQKLDERARLKKKILEKTRNYWDDPVIQERRKRAFRPLRKPRRSPPSQSERTEQPDLKQKPKSQPSRNELAHLVAPKAKPIFINRESLGQDGKVLSFGKITIPMRSDREHLSAKHLIDPIDRAIAKYNLPRSLILSVIKNESSFNPRALSPAKAMGLMQLVPTSGGKEAYSYLLGREATPGPDVLYDPVENIMLGATYLYLLNTRYFGKIKDPETRRHLIIAAYNTGAGNVAKAFTGAMKLGAAIKKINTMSADEVYRHLQDHLPYDETKTYLARVSRDLQTFADWDETA